MYQVIAGQTFMSAYAAAWPVAAAEQGAGFEALRKEMAAGGRVASVLLARQRHGTLAPWWPGEERRMPLIEAIVRPDKVDAVKAACTGDIGDGRVFVLPVTRIDRIRTGELGHG